MKLVCKGCRRPVGMSNAPIEIVSTRVNILRGTGPTAKGDA